MRVCHAVDVDAKVAASAALQRNHKCKQNEVAEASLLLLTPCNNF